MHVNIWYTIEDGNIDIVSLKNYHIQGALNVLKESFYPFESACRAVGLPSHPEAAHELDELCVRTAKDGVSLIAIDKRNDKVVGVAFNKLQRKGNLDEAAFFENFAKTCKYDSSKGVVLFMLNADAHFDLFEHCNIDCLLEIMFMAVLPEYQSRNICTELCQNSIKLAKKLYQGENIDIRYDDDDEGSSAIPSQRPYLVSALFTSPISQRVGRKLNMQIATRIGYDQFFHNGNTFSSVLGDEVPDTTLEYIDLRKDC